MRPYLLLATAVLAVNAHAADPHSYAETDKFVVRHVALDLRTDFEAHRLEGTAELTVEQVDPAAGHAVRARDV
jgi:leukotriene-A4 hydrolase